MSVMKELNDRSLAEVNNNKPVITSFDLIIEDLGSTDPTVKVKLLVKAGQAKNAVRALQPHINAFIKACEAFNETKKGGGDGTYQTTMASFDLGL